MQLLLVYRPEAAEEDADARHAETPFDGVEIYGTYPYGVDLLPMTVKLQERHQDWQFMITQVGGAQPSDEAREFEPELCSHSLGAGTAVEVGTVHICERCGEAVRVELVESDEVLAR